MKLHIADNLSLPIDAVTQTLQGDRLAKKREYDRKWRDEHREEVRLYYARYRAEHPELKEYHARYFQSVEKVRIQTDPEHARRRRNVDNDWKKRNRQKVNANWKRWAIKHPDKLKAIELRHRVNRREKKKVADREYRRTNRESWTASVERSKAKKPHLYRQHAIASAAARRAHKRSNPVERVSIARIIARDHDKCHLCLRLIEFGQRSVDHLMGIIPLTPLDRKRASFENQ